MSQEDILLQYSEKVKQRQFGKYTILIHKQTYKINKISNFYDCLDGITLQFLILSLYK